MHEENLNWYAVGNQHDHTQPLVIAFAGYIGAGKDTAATAMEEWVRGSDLLQALDVKCKATSFAKPVKEMLKYIYNLDDNDVYGHIDRAARERPHANMNGMSPRRAMQLIATEGFRDLVDYDTWVKHWYRNEFLTASPSDILYLTDFRFQNEYAFLRSHCNNFLVYFIDRIEKGFWQRVIDRYDFWNITGRRSHDSERQIDAMIRSETGNGVWQTIPNKGNLLQFKHELFMRFANDIDLRFCLE